MAFEIKTNFVKQRPQKVGRVRFEFIMDSSRDKDVIKKLNSQPNKAEYIRKLIQEDIRKDTQ